MSARKFGCNDRIIKWRHRYKNQFRTMLSNNLTSQLYQRGDSVLRTFCFAQKATRFSYLIDRSVNRNRKGDFSQQGCILRSPPIHFCHSSENQWQEAEGWQILYELAAPLDARASDGDR